MLTLSRPVRRRLADLADGEIRRTFAGHAGAPAPLEAREAAGATISTALPAAADAWSSVLQTLGLKCQVIGAFSLGVPIVRFLSGGIACRCGLADLMIIVDDLTGQTPDRRALLVRALSMAANDEGAGWAEHQLFAEWPPFEFENLAYSRGPLGLRPASEAAAEISGCLAQIDLASGAAPWTLLTPVDAGKDGVPRSLGAALAFMAGGSFGRKATPGGSDDWSRTLDELLRRTATATIEGLRPHPQMRSVTTYKGERGSGFVVFENRTGLKIEAALANGPATLNALTEGPLSVVQVVFTAGEAVKIATGTTPGRDEVKTEKPAGLRSTRRRASRYRPQ